MLRIFCKSNAARKEFPEGTTLLEILSAFDFDREYPMPAAKVNNVVEGLKFLQYFIAVPDKEAVNS